MRSHGQTATWGTHIDIGRASGSTGWYEHLKAWWTAHQAMRREARLAVLAARWDAKREALTPLRADAASDLVAPAHVFSTTTTLCDLGV
jgi:hypothetical protein